MPPIMELSMLYADLELVLCPTPYRMLFVVLVFASIPFPVTILFCPVILRSTPCVILPGSISLSITRLLLEP